MTWTFSWQLQDPPNPSLPLDLLWADPDQHTNEFKYSDRGVSLTFGIKVVNKVCEKFNLDLICRAHQVSRACSRT